MTVLLSLFITGCDQAPKAPSGVAVGASLAPISGGANLPKFSEWIAAKGVTINAENETFVVDGNSTSAGYQIESPLIAVKPGADIIVRIDHTVESGTVCPGVLTENSGAWIAPASAMTKELRFNTGSNKGIVVVMANCNQPPQENTKSKFRLKSGVISFASK